MTFELEHKLPEFTNHVYWKVKQQLKNGYCIYSIDQKKLKICSSLNFDLKEEIDYPPNLAINLYNGALLTWKNGIIRSYNIEKGTNSIKLERSFAEGDYGGFLTHNHLIESSRKYENYKLVEKRDNLVNIANNEPIRAISDLNTELFNIDFNFFEYDKAHQLIKKLDHETGILVWEQSYNLDIDPRFSVIFNDHLYLVTSENSQKRISKYALDSGEKKWESLILGSKFYLYKDQVIILNGQKVMYLDANNGNPIADIEIEFLIDNQSYVSSHLTDLNDSNLFFTTTVGSNTDKKAIIGVFNLNTKIVSTFELEIDSKADRRGPIGRPLILGNLAYVEFSPNILAKYKYAI